MYLLPDFKRQFREFFEPVRRALGVHDIGAEKRAAAIELKIEVARIGFWLSEKLNATVLPDFVKVISPYSPTSTGLLDENCRISGITIGAA